MHRGGLRAALRRGTIACSGSCEDSLSPNRCLECDTQCADGQKCSETAGYIDGGCPSPEIACGDTCVDTFSSPAACGGCGKQCYQPRLGKAVCNQGTCGVECPPGYALCNDECIRLDADPKHCGECGNRCPEKPGAITACEEGQCTYYCSAGLTQCGDVCADTDIDNDHCGACNQACPDVCIEGRCESAFDPFVASATDLVESATNPSIAVDDDAIYWSDPAAGTISRKNKTEGDATVLVSNQLEQGTSSSMRRISTGRIRGEESCSGLPRQVAFRKKSLRCQTPSFSQ